MTLSPGLSGEIRITVQDSDTARASGGETLPPVLGTPRLIAYLERTAHQSILPDLPAGKSSTRKYPPLSSRRGTAPALC